MGREGAKGRGGRTKEEMREGKRGEEGGIVCNGVNKKQRQDRVMETRHMHMCPLSPERP